MNQPTPAYSRQRRTSPQIIAESLDGAQPVPFWLDSPDRPQANPALAQDITTDLVVIGGGYCGLWTALRAKERDPGRAVVLIEGQRIGGAASGKNGGFCESSLTHGTENGLRHFSGDLAVLDRLADENFAGIADTLERYQIDAEFEQTGVLVVAAEEHQIPGLREAAAGSIDARFLDAGEVTEVVNSPVYRAGLFKYKGYAYVHPAKLAWGLRRACIELGVRIFENTPALKLSKLDDGVRVHTKSGSIIARQAALATNGFPSLLARTDLLTVPIYDYAIVTEPLTDDQLESIGWTERHGITDSSREFHYYRKTADNRILFGGFDAIYHRGGKVVPEHDQRTESFELLADHFFITFPQLQGVKFTHQWGGMIDMSTQLVAFHHTAWGGRVAYSAGYTGLGVGATRFGADTMLDLLAGESTDRTALKMVQRLPIPIPPEPVAYPAIQIMRRAVERSDANGGKDGLLLKIADAFGIGFDS